MIWMLVSLLCGTATAADASEPPSGTGPLVTGLILSGVGAVNLVTAPVCKTGFYYDQVGSVEAQNLCLASSLVIAAGGLGAGIPLTVIGLRQRRAHTAWEADKLTLGAAPRPGGAVAVVSGRW
ncbi:MAG: hypothetical protein R3F59_01275 [Myxococcota bacterium]